MQTINFYRVSDPYGFFSNFAPYPITIAGVTWPTSEHYFQAQKFDDPTIQARIRATPSPMAAATLGRDRSFSLRPDWEQVKDQVMYEALRAKFTQHPELRAQLLGTGDATLVEHTTNDAYWGDGGDGRGRNMLGTLLMRLRDELRRLEAER
jgi:N-glycosidase YbiA